MNAPAGTCSFGVGEAAVRRVQASQARDRDEQIARIVAVVDAMPHRGEADALIAPLRQRLAQLRPSRPFGFTRLLFTPLDPVIVQGPRWRRGEVGVPRAALAPIAGALRAALPVLAERIEMEAKALPPDDRAALAALGATLWPRAAALLAGLPTPPDWSEASGLAFADYAELAATIASVLAEAPAIEALAATGRLPADEAVRAVLARSERRGGMAAASVMAVLLARLPLPGQVLALACEPASSEGGRPAEDAMDHCLARLQTTVAAGSAEDRGLTEAALDAARVAAMLAGLEGSATKERRRRLEQIRQQADTLCLGRFGRAATATMAQVGVTLLTGDDDAAVSALETAARDLRRLETAGRRLGSGEQYDAMLHALSAAVRTTDRSLELADRVRLVEILCGPDAALALLEEPAG